MRFHQHEGGLVVALSWPELALIIGIGENLPEDIEDLPMWGADAGAPPAPQPPPGPAAPPTAAAGLPGELAALIRQERPHASLAGRIAEALLVDARSRPELFQACLAAGPRWRAEVLGEWTATVADLLEGSGR